MIRLFAAGLAAASVGAWAGGASAQGFVGAEISAEGLHFSEDDFGNASYAGGVEGNVLGFGAGANIDFFDFGGSDGLRTLTLHASTSALPFATLGAFVARDSADGDAGTSYGIEAAGAFAGAEVEGYLGRGEDEDADVTLVGFDASYEVTPTISVGLKGDRASGDGVGVGRLAVSGGYTFGFGPEIFAEVGRLGAEADGGGEDGATFVGIGARIRLGAGTTFGGRGLSNVFGGD